MRHSPRPASLLPLCVPPPTEAPPGAQNGGPRPEKSHRQRVDVEDEEVEGHGEADGAQQPDVYPGRHPQEGLILRQAAKGRPGGAQGGGQHKKEVVSREREGEDTVVPGRQQGPAGRPHLFRALHISMVTSTDKAMVMGSGASKTSQSTPSKSGFSSLHCMK